MTVEVVMLVPVILGLLLFAVYTGRMGMLDHSVRRAAHDAARAAVLELDSGDAEAAVHQVLLDSLGAAQLSRCDPPIIDTKNVGFAEGGNDTGIVTVDLNCRISLGGLNAFLPDKSVSAYGYEPIDDYRSRRETP